MIAFYLIRQVPFALMDDHRSPALFLHEVGSKLQKRDRKPRFHLLVPIVFTAVDHTHFSVSLDLLGGHTAFGSNRSKALMQYMVVVENVEVSVRNRLFDVLRDEARIEDA